MDKDDKNKNPEQNKTSRHTWIGDEEEVRKQEAMTERRTYTLSPQATRIVQKQKKKYSGFITDEELENSDIIKIEDRKTTLVNKEDISQTRIYDPFEKQGTEGEPEDKGKAQPKSRYITITVSDSAKFKRIIALLAVFLILIAFEVSYFVLKSYTGKIPAETQTAKTQTEQIVAENEQLTEQIGQFNSKDEMKELKESWERLKQKIGNTE
ncbi:MAG: hypothetical protein IJH43_05655 [Mogibacterium sp.]|nr:hypothetical protein [Mogibacterium sp.]